MDSVKPQPPEVRQVIDAVVYVAASVDGYIARADGSLDWLPNADPDQGERESTTNHLTQDVHSPGSERYPECNLAGSPRDGQAAP